MHDIRHQHFLLELVIIFLPEEVSFLVSIPKTCFKYFKTATQGQENVLLSHTVYRRSLRVIHVLFLIILPRSGWMDLLHFMILF